MNFYGKHTGYCAEADPSFIVCYCSDLFSFAYNNDNYPTSFDLFRDYLCKFKSALPKHMRPRQQDHVERHSNIANVFCKSVLLYKVDF